MFKVDNEESFQELISYINEETPNYKIEGNIFKCSQYTIEINEEYLQKLKEIKRISFLYGKNQIKGVIAAYVKNDKFYVVTETETHEFPLMLWIVSNVKLKDTWQRLYGNNYYRYIRYYSTVDQFEKAKSALYKNKKDIYTISNLVENQLMYYGITFFKGMNFKDVPRLGFDIEADGLNEHKKSTIFTISNTFRCKNKEIKKVFRLDHYSSQKEMIDDWCEYVRQLNPAIMIAHNGFGYDIKYLNHVAKINGTKLRLGVNGEPIEFDEKSKDYRVDGSQSWEYKNCHIVGRNLVDTMFLAVKYDIGRNFPSWGLKPIMQSLGMVKEGRQFYDASLIYKNWYIPKEREKIVEYCKDDGDDCLDLYELMAPSFFYMCQSIPKTFQDMLLGASGGWLNSILIRGYLQESKSLPKAEKNDGTFGGGVSFGIPGIHRNVFKIDVASLYPSIMRQFKINDLKKDPDGKFSEMVETFTIERFKNKRLHKETGDKYYDDVQASMKVFINSAYGMLGTPGLAFNSFYNAAKVTGIGRQVIRETMKWATSKDLDFWWVSNREYSFEDDKAYEGILQLPFRHNFAIVNADTDSISFKKKDESEFTEEERKKLLDEVNSLLPELIKYEDDGYYDTVVVVKAKNYVLKEANKPKIKYKGSAFKSSSKEPILKDFLHEVIEESLIYQKKDYVEIYEKYVKMALNITDIKPWCVKKSITETLLSSERTNETKIVEAMQGSNYRVGDKVYLYSAIEGQIQATVKGEPVFLKNGEPKMIDNCVLKCVDQFDGNYDKWHYVERVYKTIQILDNVIDMNRITKYHLRTNRKLLEEKLCSSKD